jgi:hypothetical protein
VLKFKPFKTFENYLITFSVIFYAYWWNLKTQLLFFYDEKTLYTVTDSIFNEMTVHFLNAYTFIEHFKNNFILIDFLKTIKNSFMHNYSFLGESIQNTIFSKMTVKSGNPIILQDLVAIEWDVISYYQILHLYGTNALMQDKFAYISELLDVSVYYTFSDIWYKTYHNTYLLFDLISNTFNLKPTNYIFFSLEDVVYIVLSLCLIISILISVAFFTLLERKVMASMQRRKGPDNRISGFWGILQPLADGLKLLTKEIIVPKKATLLLFIGAPMYTFLMSLMGWCVIP